MTRSFALASALLLVSACGDDSEADEPSMERSTGGDMGNREDRYGQQNRYGDDQGMQADRGMQGNTGAAGTGTSGMGTGTTGQSQDMSGNTGTGTGTMDDDATAQRPTREECREPQIFFATSSARLDDEARQKLDMLVQCVQNREIEQIEVVGRADPRGNSRSNEQLGRRRAQAVAQYLRGKGLEEPEIEVTSEGEEGASNTRLRWRYDRRADVSTE